MKNIAMYGLLISVAVLPLLAGCPCATPPEEPRPITKTEPVKVEDCEPCGTVGMSRMTRYLPGPGADCATVKVEKAAPEVVRVGQEFEYHLKVTNEADSELVDVKVWDTQMANFKLNKAEPAVSKMEKGWLVWDLGTLKPGQAKLIKVHGVATDICVLTPCAEVTYRMPRVCMNIRVVQPSLTLTKTAPSERLQCDPIPITLTVKNTGSGDACNVEVHDPLPDGLKTMDGKKELTFMAGRLKPGESRQFQAQLVASKVGRYQNKAFATADGGLRADATPTMTNVVKPELSVTKTGPEMRYVGRPVTYDITVLNGAGVAEGSGTDAVNTVLSDAIPSGARFVSATHGGEVRDGKVVWNLGTIKPRASKKVSVTFVSDNPGVLKNSASVTASCGTASTTAQTRIEGIPAILLEVVDLEDPIELGSNVTYKITVTNQGSAVGTNIKVACVIPVEQTYVSSDGRTKAAVDGQNVTFAPLASLAPKAEAEYTVTVKARRAGDVRFKVTLNSDQMTTPAMETEATRLYE